MTTHRKHNAQRFPRIVFWSPREDLLPTRPIQNTNLPSYRIEGEGAPLLLIHGFGISFNIWSNLLPYLTPHFQCIMIELPGIGQSPSPDSTQPYYELCAAEIERVRCHLRIDHWAIFSYSSGSRAAELYINRFPERVERAVFLCPIHLTGWRWLLARAVLRLDNHFPALGDWTLSGSRLRLLVRVLGFNGRDHPSAVNWSTEIGSQDINILKRTLRDMPNAGRGLLELATPALFVWGKNDIIPKLPHWWLRRQGVRQCLPIHRLIAAGHSAPELTAEQVAKESLPFLEAIAKPTQWALL